MSRWGKPKKNQRKFDPRYFLNERSEQINEIYRDIPAEEFESDERGLSDEVPVILKIKSSLAVKQLIMKKYDEEIKKYENILKNYNNRPGYREKIKEIEQHLEKFEKEFPERIFDYLDRWSVFGPTTKIHIINRIKKAFDGWNEEYGARPGWDAVKINYEIENAIEKDVEPHGQLYDMERDPTEIIPGQRFPARKE